MLPRSCPLVLVTDPCVDLGRTVEVVTRVARAVGAGQLVVQLRDKVSDASALHHAARVLREVTHREHAWLVLNEIDSEARASFVRAMADEVGADGVHLPSSALPLGPRVVAARALLGADAWITTAAHDDRDVHVAMAAGASAVLVSPIFTTPGKGPGRGVGALAAARAIVDAARLSNPMLVYALGGITHHTASSCARAGADGVAAIRALYALDALDEATNATTTATALAFVEPFHARRYARVGPQGT